MIRIGMLFFLLIAAAAPNSPNCEAELQARAQAKFGYIPEFTVTRITPLSDHTPAEGYRILARNPVYGTSLAILDFEVYGGGRIVHIEKIQVLNDNNKGKGLSGLLFAKMLEQTPKVRKLVLELAEDNLRVMVQALRVNHGNVELAFRVTPIYKTASHFGFTEFRSVYDHSIQLYNFVMTYGSPH